MNKVAIFASGTGTNAKKIIEHFHRHPTIQIALLVCNKPRAGVIIIAGDNEVPVLIIETDRFFRGDAYVTELMKYDINFIVLAGFLWKIPLTLIQAFQHRIINIHPALLPKYGGKGMYGSFVHEAVLKSGDSESGITIHFVDEQFDNGEIIFQAKCAVETDDSPEKLAARIRELEHQHFPVVIEKTIQLQNRR